ncbi:MAG: hypothetical protein JXA96_08445 [Sedimentisphaerales bacterium]|nr:hypothetical protein [Sedimentisphaerales bacterium]
MLIGLIEDDHQQAKWTMDLLESAFEELCFHHFSCSAELMSALPDMADIGLDLVIADMIMLWSPHEVKPDWEFEHGGIRLVEAIRSTSGLDDVPVVFWTIYSANQINSNDLPHRSIVVSKALPPDHLIRVIRSVLIATGKVPQMRTNALWDMSDSVEFKPGCFGVSVDLKKVFAVLMKKGRRAQQEDR